MGESSEVKDQLAEDEGKATNATEEEKAEEHEEAKDAKVNKTAEELLDSEEEEIKAGKEAQDSLAEMDTYATSMSKKNESQLVDEFVENITKQAELDVKEKQDSLQKEVDDMSAA